MRLEDNHMMTMLTENCDDNKEAAWGHKLIVFVRSCNRSLDLAQPLQPNKAVFYSSNMCTWRDAMLMGCSSMTSSPEGEGVEGKT